MLFQSQSGMLVGLGLWVTVLGACASSEIERHSGHARSFRSGNVAPPSQTKPVTAEATGSGEGAEAPAACCPAVQGMLDQRALARTALRFVGAPRIEANGQRFTFDCSGLARAVYFSHGVDLFDGQDTHGRANGVRLIQRYVHNHGRLHVGPSPQPGDLVFFHNTWDANQDRRLNDRWTHVGVVEQVRDDGTIVFVSRVSRGIERYRMNLQAPNIHRSSNGMVLNDFLRRKRRQDNRATRYLTGQLFAGFGTLTH